MENRKVLMQYCLYDKEISFYDCFCVSYDDKDAVNYFMGMFRDIIFSLTNEDDLSKFEDKLKNTCIYKIASFDNLTGEFINEKNLLVDYLDINTVRNYFDITKNKEKEIKNES